MRSTKYDPMQFLKPEEKCYCCWHKKGECGHCPPDKTGLDKLNDSNRNNAERSSVCMCNSTKPDADTCYCHHRNMEDKKWTRMNTGR